MTSNAFDNMQSDETRAREALGALRTVADRLRGHVAEQWLMGHPHPKGMTLGEYLRVAIKRAGNG